MTILTVINSIRDFIFNCSLTKQRYTQISLNGFVGSCIFRISVGFGLALILRFLEAKNKNKFEEYNLAIGTIRAKVVLCAMIGLILNLL